MGKASTRQRPARPTGAARRRAQVKREKRNKVVLRTTMAVVLALLALVVVLHLTSRRSSSAAGNGPTSATGAGLSVGTTAPNGTFTTLAGKTETVAALRGKPTLLWLVTTWCSSCEAGTQAMAQNVATLAADGVRVVEVENYGDLGQSGPTMASFAKTLAGGAYSNPDWTFAVASSAFTRAYNPNAYLDIYYLINAQGKITYVNSSPASTMAQLLGAAKALA